MVLFFCSQRVGGKIFRIKLYSRTKKVYTIGSKRRLELAAAARISNSESESQSSEVFVLLGGRLEVDKVETFRQ